MTLGCDVDRRRGTGVFIMYIYGALLSGRNLTVISPTERPPVFVQVEWKCFIAKFKKQVKDVFEQFQRKSMDRVRNRSGV